MHKTAEAKASTAHWGNYQEFKQLKCKVGWGKTVPSTWWTLKRGLNELMSLFPACFWVSQERPTSMHPGATLKSASGWGLRGGQFLLHTQGPARFPQRSCSGTINSTMFCLWSQAVTLYCRSPSCHFSSSMSMWVPSVRQGALGSCMFLPQQLEFPLIAKLLQSCCFTLQFPLGHFPLMSQLTSVRLQASPHHKTQMGWDLQWPTNSPFHGPLTLLAT